MLLSTSPRVWPATRRVPLPSAWQGASAKVAGGKDHLAADDTRGGRCGRCARALSAVAPRLRGPLADVCALSVLFYCILCTFGFGGIPGWDVRHARATHWTPSGSYAYDLTRSDWGNAFQALLDTHTLTPVLALFLYGASARGGAGCAARFLAHPAL